MSANYQKMSTPVGAILALLLSVNLFSQQPKFSKAAATLDNSTGDLTFAWTETHLQGGATINYVLDTNQYSYWVCSPQKSNFNETYLYNDVFQTGISLPVQRDSITASFQVDLGEATAALSSECVAGQTLVLGCVVYSDPAIVDSTNNVAYTFSAKPFAIFDPKVPGCTASYLLGI